MISALSFVNSARWVDLLPGAAQASKIFSPSFGFKRGAIHWEDLSWIVQSPSLYPGKFFIDLGLDFKEIPLCKSLIISASILFHEVLSKIYLN